MQLTRLALVVFSLVCTLTVGQQLAQINITAPFFIPESFDFDPTLGYLIGSIGVHGAWKVNPTTGALSELTTSPNLTMSTFGMDVDRRGGRNRLLVCVSNYPPNPTPAFQAGVAVINLVGTPTQTAFYDMSAVGPMGAPRLCNDLVSDNAGNIYATDSFGAQVWKIDTAGVVTQHATSPFWEGSGGQPFGTDGIELTPQGHLLVGHLSDVDALNTIWRVPTSAPVSITQIQVDGSIFGNDGIYFGPAGCLYIVGNAVNSVYRLASNDSWVTAKVLETVQVQCTTPTAITRNTHDGNYYVSCANGFGNEPYPIERVTFAVPETVSLCTGAASSGAVASWLMILICMMMLMGVKAFNPR